MIDFDELRVDDSTQDEGNNTEVRKELEPNGWFVVCSRKTIANGWYSGMVAPVSSIVGLLILYS